MSSPGDEKLEFTFRKCLGAGGFGEVYLAEHYTKGGISRLVAVKVLKSEFGADSDAVKRLRDEGQILAMMQHPAILGVHHFAEVDGRIALVTEYIEGIDLASYCVPGNLMPKRAALGIVGEVASALDFAYHTNNPKTGRKLKLIHRDIKPENIRLSIHGQVKVLDFGVARSNEMQRAAKTAMGDILMTPGYGAPESLAFGVTGPKVDVYALGATLYRMITGEKFYQDKPITFQLNLAMDTADYAIFLDKRLDLVKSIPISELLRDMLQHTPERRLTAADVCDRCEDLVRKLKGPPYQRWARERDEHTVSAGVPGPLVGKSVTHQGEVVQASNQEVRRAQTPHSSSRRQTPSPAKRHASRQPTRKPSRSPSRTPASAAARTEIRDRDEAPPPNTINIALAVGVVFALAFAVCGLMSTFLMFVYMVTQQ
jgi:serine/threonine protein kinase